ncbi:MAG: GIY-YIG nuclease family protein [Gammaproteobacteria bacterium]|nr:GIY-YIG nuclease family protein [Gammaproteobacteria bacterium]
MSDRATVWHVYILRCVDSTLYTGVTTRVADRVAAHNAGRGAKYTRGRLPVELVYEERIGDRGDALSREAQIKRLSAIEKRRLVAEG